MNTNYSKWAKFDVEKALQDTESRGEDEDIRAECAKKSLEHEKQLQSLQETSKQSAAALRSKMAVEALKKKGRARGSATETTPASTTASSEKIEPSAPSDTLHSQAFMVTSRVAGHLEGVHASLAQVLSGVETLKAQPHAEASGRLGAQLLDALHTLHDLRRELSEDLRSAGDGNENFPAKFVSIVYDIGVNIGKLRVEVLDCMSIRALCRGDYGACAEMTRVGLRFVQKQAGSNSLAERRSDRFSARRWILRSLAYLGMGCPYLANVHARQAASACPEFQGLSDLCSYLDQTEELYALGRYSLEALIAIEILRSLKLLGMRWDGTCWLVTPIQTAVCSVGDALVRVDVNDIAPLFSDYMAPGSASTAPIAITSSALYIDQATVQHGGESVTSLLQNVHQFRGELMSAIHVEHSLRLVLMSAARRLYYEGEVLRQEHLHRVSASKYQACMFLSLTAIHSQGDSIDPSHSSLCQFSWRMLIASALSCAVCKGMLESSMLSAVATAWPGSWDSFGDLTIASIASMRAVDLVCAVKKLIALSGTTPSTTDRCIISFRLCFVLEKLLRFSQALHELDELELYLTRIGPYQLDGCESSLFVELDRTSLWTERFILGSVHPVCDVDIGLGPTSGQGSEQLLVSAAKEQINVVRARLLHRIQTRADSVS